MVRRLVRPTLTGMAKKIPSLDLSGGFMGKLIVALPHLDDTPFGQSLCLICSHDDEHAFGVIVNKPMTGVTVGEVLSQMDMEADPVAAETPVFFGGPVELERGAVLHSLDYRQTDTVLITPHIGLTATKDALKAICTGKNAPRDWLLIMGHAGWEGGQLENEIKRNDWLGTPASGELIFGDAAQSWQAALHDLGISDLSLLDGGGDIAPRPQ